MVEEKSIGDNDIGNKLLNATLIFRFLALFKINKVALDVHLFAS
jgi:hypothetical protein